MSSNWFIAAGLALLLLAPGQASAQGAQGAQAQQVALPDAEKIVLLVRNSLITLNDALQTGNFTVLRDRGAPGFREANSAARLSQIFSDLVAKKVDLSAVAVVAPQLSQGPGLDKEKGMLHQGLLSRQARADRFRAAVSGGERPVAPVRHFRAARQFRGKRARGGLDGRAEELTPRDPEIVLSVKPSQSPRVSRLVTAMLRPFWRLRRGMTLGAQGVVIDAQDRVLLVRHSYRPGWFFPGGGVEWGETLEDALYRELEEEVGVTLTGEPVLHGVFSNNANFPGDHIAVYLVRRWTRDGDYRQKSEIAEAEMFAADDVPARTDPGTRHRLAEIFRNAPLSAHWKP